MSARIHGKLSFEPVPHCDLVANLNDFQFEDQHHQTKIVADAKLLNRKTLLAELSLYHSNLTDTQLILQCYHRWGKNCAHHLLGDFAFAIWDAKQKQLLLGRDPLGKRTLLYYVDPWGHIFFGSTIIDLLSHYPIPIQLNQHKLADYLIHVLQDNENTFYKGIKRLVGGHLLTANNKQYKIQSFWSIQDILPEPLSAHALATAAEYCREIIHSNITAWLPDTGFLGCHLSGGFDSSAVTSLAAYLLENKKLFAFNFNLPDHLGITKIKERYPNIHILYFSTMQTDNQDLYHWMDQPYRIPSALSWHSQFFAAAKQNNISILLTGDMGNYNISWHGLADNKFQMRTCLTHLWKWMRRRFTKKTPLELASAIHPHFARQFNLDQRYRQYIQNSRKLGRLFANRAGIFKYHMHEAENTLYNALRAHYGVDTYDPFADKRLFELCARLPNTLFTNGYEYRLFAKKVFHEYLPPSILENKNMTSNTKDWALRFRLQRTVFHEILSRWRQTEIADYLDLPYLRALLEKSNKEGYFILERAIEIGIFIENRFI